jgi:sigma-E factor negative regulatory protein RseA
MSEELREQLSALVDGELPSDQMRFLLRRIDADPSLARCWSRYQLVGAVMRRQNAALAPVRKDFADTLRRRLDHEARGRGGLRVLRWAGGGAIAAAVAVVALVSNRPSGHAPMAAATIAAVPTSAVAAPRAQDVFMPIAPSFDYAQPASYDTGLFSLPRYDLHAQYGIQMGRHAQAPFVLLTVPPQPPPVVSAQPQRQ